MVSSVLSLQSLAACDIIHSLKSLDNRAIRNLICYEMLKLTHASVSFDYHTAFSLTESNLPTRGSQVAQKTDLAFFWRCLAAI